MPTIEEYQKKAHAVIDRRPLYESVSILQFGIPKHFIDRDDNLSSRPDVLRHYVMSRRGGKHYGVRWVRIGLPLDFDKFIKSELKKQRKTLSWLVKKAGVSEAGVSPARGKAIAPMLRALGISISEEIREHLAHKVARKST